MTKRPFSCQDRDLTIAMLKVEDGLHDRPNPYLDMILADTEVLADALFALWGSHSDPEERMFAPSLHRIYGCITSIIRDLDHNEATESLHRYHSDLLSSYGKLIKPELQEAHSFFLVQEKENEAEQITAILKAFEDLGWTLNCAATDRDQQ